MCIRMFMWSQVHCILCVLDSRIIENGVLRVKPVCWVNAWLGILVYVHSYEEWYIFVEYIYCGELLWILENYVFGDIIHMMELLWLYWWNYTLEIICTYSVLEDKSTWCRGEPEISQTFWKIYENLGLRSYWWSIGGILELVEYWNWWNIGFHWYLILLDKYVIL